MDRNLFVLGYLDAGTGSLIFQVLVASLVSAGVVFGGVITQLRTFFSRVVLRRPKLTANDLPRLPEESVIGLRAEQTPEPLSHRKAA